jgi:hypothetical protein
MQYLFIGGEADGQRIDVNPNYPQISIPIRQYTPISMYPGRYRADATEIKHELYRREAIHFGPNDRIEFFVQIDLTPRQAMERLMAHYAPSL